MGCHAEIFNQKGIPTLSNNGCPSMTPLPKNGATSTANIREMGSKVPSPEILRIPGKKVLTPELFRALGAGGPIKLARGTPLHYFGKMGMTLEQFCANQGTKWTHCTKHGHFTQGHFVIISRAINMIPFGKEFNLTGVLFFVRNFPFFWTATLGEMFPFMISNFWEEFFWGILSPPGFVANILRISNEIISKIKGAVSQICEFMGQFWSEKMRFGVLGFATPPQNEFWSGGSSSTDLEVFSDPRGQYSHQLISIFFPSNVKLLPPPLAHLGISKSLLSSKAEKRGIFTHYKGFFASRGSLGPRQAFFNGSDASRGSLGPRQAVFKGSIALRGSPWPRQAVFKFQGGDLESPLDKLTNSGSFFRHFRENNLTFDQFCPSRVKDMAHRKHITLPLTTSLLCPVKNIHFAKDFPLACHDLPIRIPSHGMSIWNAPFGETFPPMISIFLEETFLGILDPPRVVANFLRITSGTLSTVGRVWGQFWHCMDQFWQKKTLVEALELPTTFVNNSAPEKKVN